MDKPFKNLTIVATILALGLIMSNCAPSTRVPVTRPAEINLMGTESIAIGDITGNVGRDLSDSITQKLFQSGRYEVLDRENINRIMREHNLNLSGAVDASTAASIGNLVGASALIFGSSDAQFRQTTERQKYHNKKGKGHYYVYTKNAEARVNTMLKVVDLETGKILAVKNFTEEETDRLSERNQWPPDPDRRPLIDSAINKTSESFMKMIAPYTDYVHVEFENSDSSESKTGIEFAKSGQWDEALNQFQRATDKYPKDAAAWYNLGLAHEYNYQFDEAIEALNRSNALKPSQKCIEEIGNCKILRGEQAKLKMQLQESENTN